MSTTPAPAVTAADDGTITLVTPTTSPSPPGTTGSGGTNSNAAAAAAGDQDSQPLQTHRLACPASDWSRQGTMANAARNAIREDQGASEDLISILALGATRLTTHAAG